MIHSSYERSLRFVLFEANMADDKETANRILAMIRMLRAEDLVGVQAAFATLRPIYRSRLGTPPALGDGAPAELPAPENAPADAPSDDPLEQQPPPEQTAD